jgi:hypothetical protein
LIDLDDRSEEFKRYPERFTDTEKRQTWDVTWQPRGSDDLFLGYKVPFVYYLGNYHPFHITLETLKAILNPATAPYTNDKKQIALFREKHENVMQGIKDAIMRYMLQVNVKDLKTNCNLLLKELEVDDINFLYLYDEKEIADHLKQRKQLRKQKRTLQLPVEDLNKPEVEFFRYQAKE